jgi:hypothetical protein
VNRVDVIGVQVIPSGELPTLPVRKSSPTATHKEPFHATPRPEYLNKLFPLWFQVLPSGEVAIVAELPLPAPTATHKDPFHAIPIPVTKVEFPNPFQVIPSVEVAIVLDPPPTATHNDPFHAIPDAPPPKILVPNPVQVIPSGDVAIE